MLSILFSRIFHQLQQPSSDFSHIIHAKRRQDNYRDRRDNAFQR